MTDAIRTSAVQDEILSFIAKNGQVKQSVIVLEYMRSHGKTNKTTARPAVSQILRKMEANKLIKKEIFKNTTSGSIDYNVWSIY